MARGQHYSKHQKKIISNYYEHRDTIALNQLGDIVTDLYLAETPKKTDALWKKAESALAKLDVNPARLRTVLESRDPARLAALVSELQST